MSEISDQLAAEALKAQSVSNDGVTVTRHSLPDGIEYANYAASKAATAAGPASMLRSMMAKFVPPGGH